MQGDNYYGDPIFLLNFVKVVYIAVKCAKFEQDCKVNNLL